MKPSIVDAPESQKRQISHHGDSTRQCTITSEILSITFTTASNICSSDEVEDPRASAATASVRKTLDVALICSDAVKTVSPAVTVGVTAMRVIFASTDSMSPRSGFDDRIRSTLTRVEGPTNISSVKGDYRLGDERKNEVLLAIVE